MIKEKKPKYGTTPDQFHGAKKTDLTWYEFGPANGLTYTLQAKSDKIAIACICLISPFNLSHIHRPRLALQAPIYMAPGADEVCDNYFGEALVLFLNTEEAQIKEALKTCHLGNIEQRESLEETMSVMLPETKKELRKKWIAKIRNGQPDPISESLNFISKYSLGESHED